MSLAPALPRSVCVRLTRRCNAACGFCQAPDTDRDVVSERDLRGLCAWLTGREVESVKLSGGEPTVRRDLPSIICLASAAGLRVTVITNGILLRDEVLDALAASDGELKFSVHGLGVDNDLVLGRTSFDQVVGNVKRARLAGVPCSINTVVTRGNRHRLRPLAQLAVDLDCRKITFIPFVPRGRGLAARSTFELTPADRALVAEQVAALAGELARTLVVREIDLRTKPYWIVENNLSLVVESWIEDRDRVVLTSDELRRLIAVDDDRAELTP